MSVILAGLSIIASAVFFAGFVENDQGFWHMVSAFVFSFSIGALAYVPLIIISLYSRRAITTPLRRYQAAIIFLLLLPWVPFTFYLSRLGQSMTVLAGGIAVILLLIGFWAGRYFRKSHQV